MSTADLLPPIRTLTEALASNREDMWPLESNTLEKACQEMNVELAKKDVAEILAQFYSLVGYLGTEFGRQDIALGVAEAMAPAFQNHLARFNDIINASNSGKMDSARANFANMMGPAPKDEPAIEPTERIDFKLPKDVKG